MLAIISGKAKQKINFIAYYQIIGGAIGLLLTFSIFVNYDLNISVWFIVLLTLGLYTFSMFCGKTLLDGKVQKGLQLSTINQLLQSVNFAMAGFAFKYVAGVNLAIGIDYTNDFQFFFRYSLSEFQVNLNSQKTLVSVGINLMAIGLIILIGNVNEEYKSENSIPINSDSLTNK